MNLSAWFRGLKGRLLFAAVMPLVGFMVVFGIAMNGLNIVTGYLETAHKTLVPNLIANGEMRQARNKFAYQAMLAFDIVAEGKDPQASLDTMNDAIKEFTTYYDLYTKAPFIEGEEAAHNKVKADIVAFIETMNKINALFATKDQNKIKEARGILEGDYAKLGKNVSDFNHLVSNMYGERASQENQAAAKNTVFVRNLLMAVAGSAALAIFAVLLFIAARISSSVGSIAQQLNQAGGNVASSVEQLNEAGNTLSQSSTEAAASLEETVASLEELTSMVKQNSDNAKQAASLAVSSRDAAEKGEQEIQALIRSMTEISKSSKKIEEIISVIDDIAFQTNLLALNAAVEAARAGEQGKGFAVVAEAVRALAQRSASSAKDIASLIKESVSQIDGGSRIADNSGAVLNNIVNSIKKVSDLNNEIAAASSEQTSGIQQISKAMNQLDQASQSNAASAEEIAATSGEINGLADTALNLTVELNSVILGGDNSTHPQQHQELHPKKKSASKERTMPAIVPFRRSASSHHAHTPSPAPTASATIPFDDDSHDGDARGKIGTAEGF
jgi:methyl-accepting chemotaxis protein